MALYDKDTMLLNIQNSASAIGSSRFFGNQIIDHILSIHKVKSLDEIPSCDLDDVFGDLELVLNDP